MVARPASPQEDIFGAHIQVTGTVVVCLFLPAPLSSTGAVGATGTASALTPRRSGWQLPVSR